MKSNRIASMDLAVRDPLELVSGVLNIKVVGCFPGSPANSKMLALADGSAQSVPCVWPARPVRNTNRTGPTTCCEFS